MPRTRLAAPRLFLASLSVALLAWGCSRTEESDPAFDPHVRVLEESPRDYTGMTPADIVALLERKLDALEGIAGVLAERSVAEADLPSLEDGLAEARKRVSEVAIEPSDDWAAQREALVREVEELERRAFELAGPLIGRDE